ncbi:MAG: formylglycine-generating enzyme family protein [Anaerolineae bacterium]|nr:formylglycine-generating enzyme family protein [Anaerolineae bacterium]
MPTPIDTLLPAPFAWVHIPAGKVTLTVGDKNSYLKANTTFDLPAFHISKYPITNAQYAKFIEAGGYDNQKWWTQVGWRARSEGWDVAENGQKSGIAWSTPRFCDDPQFNGADYPVVGISWYEAIAFCAWLSDVTGETIILPSEQGWQRAAQGDDNRVYPWGDEFDATRCNTTVKGARGQLRQPTPVRQYEGVGDSPFGVVDMLGNVFEWCSTDYYNGETTTQREMWRMMRGGSWFHFSELATLTYRQEEFPHRRHSHVGFRIAKSE